MGLESSFDIVGCEKAKIAILSPYQKGILKIQNNFPHFLVNKFIFIIFTISISFSEQFLIFCQLLRYSRLNKIKWKYPILVHPHTALLQILSIKWIQSTETQSFWNKLFKNIIALFIALHLTPCKQKLVNYVLHNQRLNIRKKCYFVAFRG